MDDDRGCLLQGSDDQRYGHVVGKVGHQRPRLLPHRGGRAGLARAAPGPPPDAGSGPSSSAQSTVEGVGLDHPDAPGLDLGPQDGQHTPVDLDRGDLGAGLDQGQGERSESGPDLHHLGTLGDAGQTHDAADRIGVGHEVLTQGPARVQVVGGQQLVDLGSAVGHPVSVSWARRRPRYASLHVRSRPVPSGPVRLREPGHWAHQTSWASMTPWESGAISANVAVARSMEREVSASRSFTRHVTEAPLAGLVTCTSVPNGR